MSNLIGIYKITNLINNNEYVGSSTNIQQRFYNHKSQLRKGINKAKKLQEEWNLYKETNFCFLILEYTSKENLLAKEQEYIDLLNPVYNTFRIAGKTTGYKHTKEAREKISKSTKNKRKGGERKARKVKLISPDKQTIIADSLWEFCKLNDLSYTTMVRVVNKQRPHHKRWKGEYI